MALFSIFDGSFSIINQFSVFQTTVTSATQARLGVPSSVLDEVGDPQGALDAIREAVEIYRRLAAASPVRYEPDLARSVSVMSDRLEEEGNRGNQGSLATDAALRRTLSGQRTRAPLRGDAAGLRAPYGQRETGHLR